MSHCLLYLIVAPAAEDAVAEWLLEDEAVSGFSSMPIAGHGSSEASMTLAEQVAGRRRRVMFFTHLETLAAAALSGQTGVDTAIGSPKLEMIANEIMRISRKYDISPERARDMVLQGELFNRGGSVVKLARDVISRKRDAA